MRKLIGLTVAALLLPFVIYSEDFIRYYPSGSASSDWVRRPMLYVDLFPSNPAGDFVGAAVASGTSSNSAFAQTAAHPGVAQFTSSGTANSGYVWRTEITAFLIGGGEVYEAGFRLVTLTNLTARMGFGDATSVTAPVDGVFLEIPATGVALGRAISNNTLTETASTYTVVVDTWYRIRVVVAPAAASATFFLYSEAGALLWTDTVASNLPSGAGRQTGAEAIATESVGATAGLMVLDYQFVTFNSDRLR